jgi:hypothetical protein
LMAWNANLREPVSALPAFVAAAGERWRLLGDHELVSKAQG